jgi:hypothetical protein
MEVLPRPTQIIVPGEHTRVSLSLRESNAEAPQAENRQELAQWLEDSTGQDPAGQ